MKLTQQQSDKLWGEDGPYSQANIIIQTRILDDRISRVFIEVEVEINPLTYEIIQQNIKKFKNDRNAPRLPQTNSELIHRQTLLSRTNI